MLLGTEVFLVSRTLFFDFIKHLYLLYSGGIVMRFPGDTAAVCFYTHGKLNCCNAINK